MGGGEESHPTLSWGFSAGRSEVESEGGGLFLLCGAFGWLACLLTWEEFSFGLGVENASRHVVMSCLGGFLIAMKEAFLRR
jgi:hypothetical protein